MNTFSAIRLFLYAVPFICFCPPASAQIYQAPPPFDIHTPTGNKGLETVSYDISATFMAEESPLGADVQIEVINKGSEPQSQI
jgi:hypothetical protein